MKKLFKRIYRLVPLKKHLFLVLRKFWVPSRRIFQHLHFVGNFNVQLDSKKGFTIRHYGYQIENEIFWKGISSGWEKVSLSIWAELCENSKIIFDIGANTGIYSLLAKAINPNASVFAFEPVERVYEKLAFNHSLNSFNTKCVKKAISNFDGKAIIYDKDTEHILSVTVNSDISPDKETSIPTTIDTLRLDTFIDLENLTNIDLMKIDVEKHEVEALEGFGAYLKAFKPTLLIEILDDEIAKGVEKLIAGIDYEYFVIDENSGIKKVDKLRKSDYYNFLICKPEIANSLKTIARFTTTYKRN
ncbi:MAG: FkbM family methyltransferase [Bacteroidia bacterium]|nr:FkbM family methyltransferase [Bacteroidia bacterium]NNM15274.1 FkbM family methyltransferase [Bacteroidia bacterium]